MLGDMPESLYRMSIASTFKLDQLIKMHDEVLEQTVRLRQRENKPVPTKWVTYSLFPDLFLDFRCTYIGSLLLYASANEGQTTSYIGRPHFRRIKELLEDDEYHQILKFEDQIGSSSDTVDEKE